jgi:hypothetical protein
MVKARAFNNELYEADLPQYFGAIFLFAFLIFVVSFLVIFKEFRRRFKYQKELEVRMNAIKLIAPNWNRSLLLPRMTCRNLCGVSKPSATASRRNMRMS